MFNYVDFNSNCESCGEPLSVFQSKSGKELALQMLQPRDVTDFYSVCPKCKTWNEFLVIPTEIKIVKLPVTKAKIENGEK